MKCRFCRRPLRSEKSRRLGAGSSCLRKFKGYRAAKKLEMAGQLSLFSRRPWGYKKARKALESRS